MIVSIKNILLKRLIKKIKRRTVAVQQGAGQKQLQLLIKDQELLHKRLTEKLKRQEKIIVAFFAVHAPVWKLDHVYQLMKADERFDPIIVVIPYVVFGEKQLHEDMNLAYHMFVSKGYRVVKSLNEETGEWMDIRQAINPDIIFYTNPHELTRPEYYIHHFPDVLSCYVQYSFHITHLHEMQYNQLFHNKIWKAFYETSIHKKFAEKYAANKGNNVTVTGYAGTDVFLKPKDPSNDPWKIKDRRIKRIIWAPHHTIDDDKSFLSYSSFLLYADFFLELAKKYQDQLQFAFKPHPILRPKLSDDKMWGKAKTDAYYERWDTLDNTQLFEADYVDLFLTSDALIHDSASFMVEYLYLDKPILYTLRDKQVTDRFNTFGKMAFAVHQHAENKEDILTFIQNTVFAGQDDSRPERKKFYEAYLLPPNQQTASENIIKELYRFI
ncbi:CDP-glycerol glycerophosphotransferase family protein [Olivibacter sp. SDN3]|uniref:CDP-glycerol glycerophosphotransferase family protein n=1 Tax=Olivibacter sp. SDN3 TaxID=2764720 RepID=UPI0016511024|nr:CDP-glycerol glycerophosphotransferase family protein [Olivibacter sp. SDN3]QNL47745.1 CDP-glycerol glycerophosphotransferase family protein [Olivibacter sp. SDN3]